MIEPELPVLIVGGGPVGLSMSICLSRLGVASRLVERHATTTTHPKATVVNTRTMELFRQWGVEDAVRAGAVPLERMRCIVWATTLAGHEIGRLEVGGDVARLAASGRLSPTMQQICAQDIVEPALADVTRRSALATVDFGTALESFQVVDNRVEAVLRHADGSDEPVSARYLVAADGAASPVRQALGIEMVGEPDLGRLLNIYFRGDLRPWIDDRPGPLYWIVNPDAPGVFIALNGTDRWLFNTPLPDDGDTSAEACAALVRRAVGVDRFDVTVESALPWTAASLVADAYRRGPCFLVGDAAHQFPPTGGHGMNSGIQDAHNLAWKLAYVLRGAAGDALLDTYEVERRPVAQRYAEESVKNARGQRSAQRSIPAEVEHDSDDGKAIRELIASTIPAQRGHFVSPGLQLGFAYRSSAVVAASDDGEQDAMRATGPQPDGVSTVPVADTDVTTYRPVVDPGRRAPHAWVVSTDDGSRTSLLDHFDGRFTLLTIGADDPLASVASDLGVEAVVVGEHGVLLDAEGQVAEVYGLEPGDAVLVRPDGFVAWRQHAGQGGPPLAEIMSQVLSLDPDGTGATT